jgi:transcription elongation factor GreA-like protein
LEKLKNTYEVYKKRCRTVKDRNLNQAVREVLSNVLTANQIDIVLKKKKQVRWTPEEIATAITIRYFSAKCYNFLRSRIGFPLPSLSTLNNWINKLNIRRGHLDDVLRIMAICLRHLPHSKNWL